MQLRELTLCPFRNFASKTLSFPSNRTLIFGANGRGKSNVLEAISYLSIGKSVRGSKDKNAVPHKEAYFDIRGKVFHNKDAHAIRVFFGNQEGKRIFLEKEVLPKTSDLIGFFRTVHFSPEDVSIVLRTPAQRRRLLDILISQSHPSYLKDLQRYNRILLQRNHLLRSAKNNPQERNIIKRLLPWNEQLIDLGSRIRSVRLQTLNPMRVDFREFYKRFSPDVETAELKYVGSKEKDVSQINQILREKLNLISTKELMVGYTLVGPQRDDVLFELNGFSADEYASEGQLKTALIAWKLAECRFIERVCGKQPIVLLDDAFSELDERRSRLLLDSLFEFEQVIATTPNQHIMKELDVFEKIRIGE